MKYITFILLLASVNCSAQKKMAKEDTRMVGYIMLGGGAALTVGGFLTAPDVMWVSSGGGGVPNQSNSNRGTWEVQPFYAQGPRFYAICGGVTITICGAITALSKK